MGIGNIGKGIRGMGYGIWDNGKGITDSRQPLTDEGYGIFSLFFSQRIFLPIYFFQIADFLS